jgi:hypothetical protein
MSLLDLALDRRTSPVPTKPVPWRRFENVLKGTALERRVADALSPQVVWLCGSMSSFIGAPGRLPAVHKECVQDTPRRAAGGNFGVLGKTLTLRPAASVTKGSLVTFCQGAQASVESAPPRTRCAAGPFLLENGTA